MRLRQRPASIELEFRLTGWNDQGRPVVQGLKPVTIQGLEIPAGFCSDGASVPWPAVALDPAMASFGPAFAAAYYHDRACEIGVDRHERSAKFHAQLVLDGVPPVTAQLMYLAVLDWPGAEAETVERVRSLT